MAFSSIFLTGCSWSPENPNWIKQTAEYREPTPVRIIQIGTASAQWTEWLKKQTSPGGSADVKQIDVPDDRLRQHELNVADLVVVHTEGLTDPQLLLTCVWAWECLRDDGKIIFQGTPGAAVEGFVKIYERGLKVEETEPLTLRRLANSPEFEY